MSAISGSNVTSAISANGSVAAHQITNGKLAADDEDWFSVSAQRLHPDSPGKVLHYTAELGDVRLCQRYASGETKPPAYFLRALLRSDHGKQWLNAVMDGSTAVWWTELVERKRCADAYEAARK
jgi:hypothetical protein